MTSLNSGYPVGVAVILRNDAGQVLLGLRARDKLWASFGGTLERTETAEAGGLRELREETGLVLTSLARQSFGEGRKADGRRYVVLYLAGTLPEGQRPVNREPHRTIALQWFEPSELPDNMWPWERGEILKVLRDVQNLSLAR